MGRGWRALTDRDHALAVVVQILLDNLQQALNRPPPDPLAILPDPGARPVDVAAQKLVLLLHLGERDGQAPHDALIGHLVAIVGLDDQAKVEDELVALVLWVGDGDGEAQDAVLGVRVVDGDVAVEEGLARDDVLLQHVKVEEAGLARRLLLQGGAGGAVEGHDAARR